ncbi:uncharacterized protein LOC121639912 isoform X1 [Melanotaenia boesemani]|uniref:uncharacterized protein LOC121639912 isoform X1 n=1 Tax=Melanotaenia boesemani TaxID=1250792 RepID=UPI001C03F220|nr:uncharacterized protein LOC121639912 isoform X1 [Melanotaenia boesemani]
MKTFTLITASLLCSFSWVSVSVSGSQIVEVRPGEDVSLSCSNMSKQSSVFFWYRLVNTTKFSCISFMYSVHSKPEYCDGFKDGSFEMNLDISTVFLKIKKVEISDSGHYFCGFYGSGLVNLSVVHLHVKGSHELDDITSDCQKKLDVETKLLGGILAGLTVFFMTIIIGLVLQNKKLQKDAEEKPSPERKKVNSLFLCNNCGMNHNPIFCASSSY